MAMMVFYKSFVHSFNTYYLLHIIIMYYYILPITYIPGTMIIPKDTKMKKSILSTVYSTETDTDDNCNVLW